jgi:hypothetical protein
MNKVITVLVIALVTSGIYNGFEAVTKVSTLLETNTIILSKV